MPTFVHSCNSSNEYESFSLCEGCFCFGFYFSSSNMYVHIARITSYCLFLFLTFEKQLCEKQRNKTYKDRCSLNVH